MKRQQHATAEPVALSRASAARLLDMSLTTFDEVVRPHVPVVAIERPGGKRPILRWLRTDLLAFLATRPERRGHRG